MPRLNLRGVRVDLDGDDDNIEWCIATNIAQQWRNMLDDACHCDSFGDLIGDVVASPATDRARDWSAARQVRMLLTEATDGVGIWLEGGGYVTRDCCVGTLLALLGRLSVHQLSGLLVPPPDQTRQRLDRAFAEVYAMLRLNPTLQQHLLQQIDTTADRQQRKKIDDEASRVSEWTNIDRTASSPAPANLDVDDRRIVRVMLRMRTDFEVAVEILVLDNNHYNVESIYDNDALVHKLLSAFIVSARSDPDHHALSRLSIPASDRPSNALDPRGTIDNPVAAVPWPTIDHDDDTRATIVADKVVAGWFMSTAPGACLAQCLRSMSRRPGDDADILYIDETAAARAFMAAMERSGAHVLCSMIPPNATSSAMLEIATILDASDRAYVIGGLTPKAPD